MWVNGYLIFFLILHLMESNKMRNSNLKRCHIIKYVVVVLVLSFCFVVLYSLHNGHEGFKADTSFKTLSSQKTVSAVTWNIAAINNNPFEYWITADSNNYDVIMQKVSRFVDAPGLNDIPIHKVFTDQMLIELLKEFQRNHIFGSNETASIWYGDLRNRKIISEFIKDPLLGKKRLISMPDRITNTIHTDSGSILMRPTVVNCYQAELNSVSEWWTRWKHYMFRTDIPQKHGQDKIYSLIPKIEKSKYPSISEKEEPISIPLSILSLALFDSILVHMMNQIDRDSWQLIRRDICKKCNFHKNERIIEILLSTYRNSDVIFLQEVSGRFFKNLNDDNVRNTFDIVESDFLDPNRDQNSFILLKKGKYMNVQEVTEPILRILRNVTEKNFKNPIVPGDLIAVTAIGRDDKARYLFASFHGDTNGYSLFPPLNSNYEFSYRLATIPVVQAVHYFASNFQPMTKLMFGLDANTYTKPEKDQLGVTEFATFLRSKNLNSCYGEYPNPFNFTTFHARTHLQAQLNKVRVCTTPFLQLSFP